MRDFLDFLLGDRTGLAELRCLGPRGEVSQGWYDIHTAMDWLMAVAQEKDAIGWDAYVGVLPRTPTHQPMRHTTLLWADVDAKTVTKAGALARILGFPIPPSCLVDSGHGFHAYWRLDRATPVEDAREAMRGLAKALGGDAVHDPARILRLPGTSNHKDPAAAVPVRLLQLDTLRRYSLSDFGDWIIEKRATAIRVDRDGAQFAVTDFPRYLWSLIDHGVPRGQRSEAIYRVCAELVELGWPDRDITDMILAHPTGIGEKVAGMREDQARAYIARTLRKVAA